MPGFVTLALRGWPRIPASFVADHFCLRMAIHYYLQLMSALYDWRGPMEYAQHASGNYKADKHD
jgi:hypothetical protein